MPCLVSWSEFPGSKAGPFCQDSRYAIGPAVYRIFACDNLNLTSAHAILTNRPQCPGGGIGRRAGFRCQWLNGREGSSPFLGTTPFSKRLESLCPRRATVHEARNDALAARFRARAWHRKPPGSERAQGRPGADRHPWPPCVKECTGQEPQAQPDDPAFPARWLTVAPCSPRCAGLLATVARV